MGGVYQSYALNQISLFLPQIHLQFLIAKIGEEERLKFSSDVLCLGRPAVLSSLQLKGTLDFCNENLRKLFLEFLYHWLGYNPELLLCI